MRTHLTKEKINKPYVQKTWLACKLNIKNFVRPEWHRDFRESHISTIMNAMARGEHPSENITINSIGKMHRIINGNHRMEAIRRIIALHPEFCIEMTFTVYYDLTKDEEIAIYEKVNNTKTENGLDKLKAQMIGTDIMELINDRFPFRISFRSLKREERNVITAGTLLSSYMMRNDSTITKGNKFWMHNVKDLSEKDYNRMVRFCQLFKRVCGEPSRSNPYSSYNCFSVFAKLYYTTVGVDITEDEYEKKLRDVIVRHTPDLIMMNRGVHQQDALYNFVFDKFGKRKKLTNIVQVVRQNKENAKNDKKV